MNERLKKQSTEKKQILAKKESPVEKVLKSSNDELIAKAIQDLLKKED